MNRSQVIVAGGALALMIGVTAALSNSSQNSDSDSVLAVQSSSMLMVPSPVAPFPVSLPSPSFPSPALSSATYYSQQIKTCAGHESNANFRAYPSLDPHSVLGVVAYGKSVQLTGKVIQGDGVTWYEAISPALSPSPDPGAENRLEPNQVGWIASCFVGRVR